MNYVIYKNKKVYNSRQVRAFLNIEFDLILHLFYENKDKFIYDVDYYYVDREKFAKEIGSEIKGTSKMIYLWTSEGIEKLKDFLDKERNSSSIEDVNQSMQRETIVVEDNNVVIKGFKIFVPNEGLDVGDVARALQSAGVFSFGQNILFRKLRNRGVLNAYNIPYQQYIKNGMFGVFVQEKKNGAGEYLKCKVFPKGVLKITDWFSNEDE